MEEVSCAGICSGKSALAIHQRRMQCMSSPLLCCTRTGSSAAPRTRAGGRIAAPVLRAGALQHVRRAHGGPGLPGLLGFAMAS